MVDSKDLKKFPCGLHKWNVVIQLQFMIQEFGNRNEGCTAM